MSTLAIIITILIVIIITCITLIYFVSYADKLEAIQYKISFAEKKIDENLKEAKTFLIKLVNIIEKELNTESKTFSSLKKSTKLSNFDLDELLSVTISKIREISLDNKKLATIDKFNELMDSINKIELQLIALRTFYNKYSKKFNNLVLLFPYNFVKRIKKYKSKVLYKGKEIDSSLLNDIRS